MQLFSKSGHHITLKGAGLGRLQLATLIEAEYYSPLDTGGGSLLELSESTELLMTLLGIADVFEALSPTTIDSGSAYLVRSGVSKSVTLETIQDYINAQ